jgi:hypothetical protein
LVPKLEKWFCGKNPAGFAPAPTRDEPGVLWILITNGFKPGWARLILAAASIPDAHVDALVPESQNFSAEFESQ